MTVIKFDPTKSPQVPTAAIRSFLSRSEACSRDEEYLLERDLEHAARERWDVYLEVDTLKAAQALAQACSAQGLGRIRLRGATWKDPWVVSDRLMCKRLKKQEQEAQMRNRLSETTKHHLSFVS